MEIGPLFAGDDGEEGEENWLSGVSGAGRVLKRMPVDMPMREEMGE